MTGDLFRNSDGTTLAIPRREKELNVLRKGSRIRVVADNSTDSHGCEIDATGRVQEIVQGTPGNSDLWREDGSHYYLCEMDSLHKWGSMPVALWPEEIERE